MVCGAIIFVWTVIPTYLFLAGVFPMDIIQGKCTRVYSSFAVEKTVSSVIFVMAWLIPLTLMALVYTRIVYVLRTKVSEEVT